MSEALALTVKDVDRKAGTVRVLHGKGDQARVVGLDDGAMAVVDRWLDVRRVRGINGRRTNPLFCTLDGGIVSGAYVRAMLKRIGRRCVDPPWSAGSA